jgi:cytoskeletal protein CcmA (bactofilin family)
MGHSRQSVSRGTEFLPVAAASGAAFASVSPETTSLSGQMTQPAVAEGSRAASFIAADFAIEGQLRSTGRIEVAGSINGRIEADELIVLASGVVEGEVICRLLAVAGTITGTISTHELHVHDTGRVDAAIETGGITVEPGALFEGQVRRRHFG